MNASELKKLTRELKLSNYDQERLRQIAMDVVDEIIDWGKAGNNVERFLKEVFVLGFTAAARGEQTEHPPKPDWMTSEED